MSRISLRKYLVDDWFDYLVQRTDQVQSGGTPGIDGDFATLTAGSSTHTDYTVSITGVRGTETRPAITHDHPTVASHDGSGRFSFLTPGIDNITLTGSSRVETFPLAFSQSAQAPPLLQGGATGSLRKHITDALLAKAAGKDPSTTKDLFTTWDVGGAFVRNTGVWTGVWDLSSVGVWNSWGAQFNDGSQGGWWTTPVAISPIHVLFAQHFMPNLGSTLRWLSPTNVVATRTILGEASLTSDIGVGILDADLPSDIAKAKLMPANWLTRFAPSSQHPVGWALPFLWTNKFRRANLGEMIQFNNISGGGHSFSGNDAPTNTEVSLFYEAVQNHDSGNPIFFPINGELVHLSQVSSYGPFGSIRSDFISAINTATDSLWSDHFGGSNPYHVQTADLSAFNTY